jgi:hypothetical protein
MKPYAVGDQLTLTQPDGTPLGVADIDSVDGPVVLGSFRPTPEFGRVSALFHEFEECVEFAALAVLPDIERRIADLGLRIQRAGEPGIRIDDLQIFTDGGFSCRPVVAAGLNGRPGEHSTASPA